MDSQHIHPVHKTSWTASISIPSTRHHGQPAYPPRPQDIISWKLAGTHMVALHFLMAPHHFLYVSPLALASVTMAVAVCLPLKFPH